MKKIPKSIKVPALKPSDQFIVAPMMRRKRGAHDKGQGKAGNRARKVRAAALLGSA